MDSKPEGSLMGASWSRVRADAVADFDGDAPGRALERRLVEAFEREAAIVAGVIRSVHRGYRAGSVRSPWAIVDLNVKNAMAGRETLFEDARASVIARAEAWIANAGCQYERDDFEDELFGPRGLLSRYCCDGDLRARMLELWLSLRPHEPHEHDDLEPDDLADALRRRLCARLGSPLTSVAGDHVTMAYGQLEPER